MEKFKTINNFAARQIVLHAVTGKARFSYISLYNNRDFFEPLVIERLFCLVNDFAPLTLELYRSLPPCVQSYLSSRYIEQQLPF